MKFTLVVIDAKGGGESRLEFSKDEVTIGRVQGNDVILSRGNVSKRHARIVAENGEFVVVDLKSTNGTFVNGRRISGPQVITGEDKVYVGDFVLGIEEPGALPKPPPPPKDDRSGSAINVDEGDVVGADDLADLIPQAPRSRVPSSAVPSRQRERTAPPAPSELDQAAGGLVLTARSQPLPAAPPPLPQAPTPEPPEAPHPPLPPAPSAEGSAADTASEVRAHANLLELVFGRITAEFDVWNDKFVDAEDAQQRTAVESVIRDLLSQLLDAGAVPETVDPEAVVRDALDQALGIGPLGGALNDPEVREIWLSASGSLMVLRGHKRVVLPDRFTTSVTAELAVRRLYRTAVGAAPGESARPPATGCFVFALSNGARAICSVDRDLGGPFLRVFAQLREHASLESLVKRGMLTQELADFLRGAIAARRSVVVVGPPGSSKEHLAQALALVFPGSEWTVSVVASAPMHPELNSLALDFGALAPGDRESALARWHAAMLTRPERMYVEELGDEWAPIFTTRVARALQAGRGGSVALLDATSLEHAITRWTSLMEADGVTAAGARDLLASAAQFFVLVQPPASGPRGNGVVMRVAELAADAVGSIALRDLFLFRVEGSRPGGGGATPRGRELFAELVRN